jgi:CRISPR-associated protein Cas1
MEFKPGALELHDFYFTGDDYRYRLESEAKQRFIDVIRERFNSGVPWKGRVLKWDTVIEQKANDLGRFMLKKSRVLDFMEPDPKLERYDDRLIRAKILALTQCEARERGIGKSTLHYLRLNAKSSRSFRVFEKTQRRLGSMESS